MQLEQFDAIDTVPTIPLRHNSRRSMRISHRVARNPGRLHAAPGRRLEPSRDVARRNTYGPASHLKEEDSGVACERQVQADEVCPDQLASVAEEDAWLNDVGPVSQSIGARLDVYPESDESAKKDENGIDRSATNSKERRMEAFCGPDVPDESDNSDSSDTSDGSDGCSFSICASNDCVHMEDIGCGHRLWPVVLHLSQQIWQELYQQGDMVPAREGAEVEHVRKRSLGLLRAELGLARQIQSRDEAELVLARVVDEVLGYGPFEGLLKDEDISEIMVVGPRLVYVERNGRVEEVPHHFEDDQHVLRIVENMLRQSGQHIESKRPIANIRLPDGSLVSIALPPNAVKGPTISIRKSTKRPLDMADLVSLGSMTQEMADFLSACVQARLNIVICGGMGSGRTTLLGALGSCISAEERVVTIENVAELQLSQRHVVALQAQILQSEHSGSSAHLAMRDLVLHALRMRPERIIVDECRGSETVEMLQAMYSGFDGSLISMYAHNVRDCLARLEMMWLVDGRKLPVPVMRAQIACALDVIVHLLRLPDGSRKIMNIAEVQGGDSDRIKLQSIFHSDGMNGETGRKGAFRPSGFRPTFMSKLEARNLHLPDEIFVPRLN